MKHISASQIKVYDSCNRKWYRERHEGAVFGTSDAIVLGKHLHAVMEGALLAGDATLLDDEPRLELCGWLRDIIAQGPISPDCVERKVYLEEFAIPVLGYIDLVLPEGDTVIVVDHKTTSAFKYMMKQEALRTDPQAIIYCYAVSKDFPDAHTFVFRHHVILTKGDVAPERFVEVSYTREEVEGFAVYLAEKIAAMQETYAQDLAENTIGAYGNACWQYGKPCPFLPACNAQRSAATMAELFGDVVTEEQPMTKLVYRDCLPAFGDAPVAWTALVAPVLAEYATKKGVSHYLLVPYGEGTREVALGVLNAVIAGKLAWPVAGVAIDSADPAAALFCTLISAENGFSLTRALR
jgi:hypothetical protein